ncbi:hypothetical protein [Rossellomorea aquimaris]|uniref:Uncharacterized protein n=1 Tax=Rossellomorea aquimaris TaxID=189382 RepID=A0A366EQ12_9BACI|nr:hypothetical protein [Rossellomorea aquimaris]RBP04461.1 hypothetical protein DET59_106253 [Rossellomorea aquimaris]
MENISAEEKQQSIEAFLSIIRKSENALAHMKPGAPQTKLLEKRLKAARIGADVLDARWEGKGKGLDVSKKDLKEAKEVLEGLLLTLPSFLEKLKSGSGQRTYIERRIKAFQIAVSYLNDSVN